ncbi:IclR family transcriptional regulator [Tsukamurella sp. PLM1]|uniref:IclR family transcriptional regulator n=1 Tax=Tsukamurella sp. PLM1 TaxID=2929795 RepID=UPI00206C94D3|nr:IclR family transcriptional regulator [Tsukamurella sp. PLM1]BDH55442.1 IclR family transcriptional regulator [Tsukamurella sp. PLM1]
MRNRPAYGQSSVDNALLLLHILRDQGIVSVSQAAELLGVARSTAHRLLAMLVYRDFAVENDENKYVPGPSLYVAAVEHRPTGEYNTHLRPVMTRIATETGETVQLAVRTGRWVRFIATVESAQAIRVGDRRGVALPARLTAAGRAILAELSPPHLRSLYQTPGNDGEAGLSNPQWQRLGRELELTRHRGYAVNAGDTEEGLHAIGIAVRAADGSVGAALAVAGPATRLGEGRIAQIGAYLLTQADHLRLPAARPE